MRRAIVVLLGVALISVWGCSAQIKRPTDATAPKPEVRALSGFALEMAPSAREQLVDNIKFDVDELEGTMLRTLEAKDLMASDGDYSLKVVVKDIRVRSTFSAVMFGFMAGDDHLIGDAIVFDREGRPVYTYVAEASYAFGGVGGGQDSARLNWLYEEFSEVIADELVVQRDQVD